MISHKYTSKLKAKGELARAARKLSDQTLFFWPYFSLVLSKAKGRISCMIIEFIWSILDSRASGRVDSKATFFISHVMEHVVVDKQ